MSVLSTPILPSSSAETFSGRVMPQMPGSVDLARRDDEVRKLDEVAGEAGVFRLGAPAGPFRTADEAAARQGRAASRRKNPRPNATRHARQAEAIVLTIVKDGLAAAQRDARPRVALDPPSGRRTLPARRARDCACWPSGDLIRWSIVEARKGGVAGARARARSRGAGAGPSARLGDGEERARLHSGRQNFGRGARLGVRRDVFVLRDAGTRQAGRTRQARAVRAARPGERRRPRRRRLFHHAQDRRQERSISAR